MDEFLIFFSKGCNRYAKRKIPGLKPGKNDTKVQTGYF
jgi:hypothetical protein